MGDDADEEIEADDEFADEADDDADDDLDDGADVEADDTEADEVLILYKFHNTLNLFLFVGSRR